MYKTIQNDLEKLQNPEKAKQMQRFFKTGKGEYGEGDVFLGISVPSQRKIATKYKAVVSLDDIHVLMNSNIHEHRLTAIYLLIHLYNQRKSDTDKKEIVDFYLNHTYAINNWDIVDSSAHKILGPWLYNKDKSILFKLAESNDLWEQRISMIACFHDIKKREYQTTLKIADLLLHHKHDLIHKAVGWMLKEISKLDLQVTDDFLKTRYQTMPRTCLRYAIEKFPEDRRQAFLKGDI